MRTNRITYEKVRRISTSLLLSLWSVLIVKTTSINGQNKSLNSTFRNFNRFRIEIFGNRTLLKPVCLLTHILLTKIYKENTLQ